MIVNQRGFTVIELVMALGISALILTVVYSSFQSATQAREKIESGNSAHHVARVISSRIGRELQSLQFRPGDPGSRFYNGLESGIEVLSFSSSASTPLASQPGLPSQIVYRLRPAIDDEQGPLVLERTEQSALTIGEPRALRLVDGVSTLVFRFFANGQWAEDWDSNQTGMLPQAVSMTFEQKSDGLTFQTSWPLEAFGG
jgi:prepilin-type N-terminal cleavage/methylation domain-containing protein